MKSIVVCYALLFAGSSYGFVSLSPVTTRASRSSRQWERPPNNEGENTSLWPFFFPTSSSTEESLLDRLQGYAKTAVDGLATPADDFKPTGSDKTFLGRLQGYANAAEAQLDEISDWILSYSDLTPDSEQTLAGQAFLATNLAYSLAGVWLAQNGDVFFGAVTEITAFASFAYHYGQLESRGVNNLPSVRLALLIDYICAFFSIGLALLYLVTSGGDDILTVLPPSILALGTLGASWVWVKGRPYMILHGLWHFFSAYTGFLVGSIHAGAM